MKFYEVGGAVRDELLGITSKDVDFAVEAVSFEAMVQDLEKRGFKIFQSKPEFFTVRAQVPPTQSKLFQRSKVADFVLCRKDSAAGDGRRPDYVEAGTIFDDLARRDFTVNAIAKDTETGEILDPHGGAMDLKNKILKFVGEPRKRIEEDGLRVIRGYRFMVTKDLMAESKTHSALTDTFAADMLEKVSIERIKDELEKMFEHDTITSMSLLQNMGYNIRRSLFRNGLRLVPTLKAL